MGDTKTQPRGQKKKPGPENSHSDADYWTKAMVQNMKEDALLDRKLCKIEREHSQSIINLTRTHKMLTDRLDLVNWFQEKRHQHHRDSNGSETPTSSCASSTKLQELRDYEYKSELKEYWEWKKRLEGIRGKSYKPAIESELRDRLRMESCALRRPPVPKLPPLVKPSFIYRQWRKKNEKLQKINPKFLVEKRKMYILAEDADKKKRSSQEKAKHNNSFSPNKNPAQNKSVTEEKEPNGRQTRRVQAPGKEGSAFKPLPMLKERSSELISRSTPETNPTDSERSPVASHKSAAFYKSSKDGTGLTARPQSTAQCEAQIVPISSENRNTVQRSATLVN